MNINRPLVRLAALGAAGAMVLAATPAMARPAPKPGKVSNVKITAAGIAMGSGAYAVPSTWSASARTTDYQVKLVNSAGVVLDGSSSISSAHWTAHTKAAAGTMVRVIVTPFNGTRKGSPAQSSLVPLPDLTAPTGTFKLSADNNTGLASLTQKLTDDLSQGADVKGTISWGDGSTTDTTALESTVTHQYADKVENRYEPSIVLTDKAGNSATMDLGAVVVFDSNPPSGASYSLSSANGFTNYSPVALTEVTAPTDNWSPADNITRTVSWGDDSTDSWTTGAVPTHVYTTDGVHHVTVTLTDEAGNPSVEPFVVGDVTTATDSAAPVVKFRYPKKPRNVVKKWRTLRGSVADAGVGARQVQLKVIEKRGAKWFAYKPGTHRWVKVGTKARAWNKAGVSRMTPSGTGAWSKNVAHLRKGTLAYRARGVDNVGNASAWKVHSQKLTR